MGFVRRVSVIALAVGVGFAMVAPAGAATETPFDGTMQPGTAPSGTAVCTGKWAGTYRFGFAVTDQYGHAWTLTGIGCSRFAAGDGARRKGTFRFYRPGVSSLPTLVGKFRASAYSSSRGGTALIMDLKVKKEDPRRKKVKVSGLLDLRELCGPVLNEEEPSCTRTVSGSLTVDPAYFGYY